MDSLRRATTSMDTLSPTLCPASAMAASTETVRKQATEKVMGSTRRPQRHRGLIIRWILPLRCKYLKSRPKIMVQTTTNTAIQPTRLIRVNLISCHNFISQMGSSLTIFMTILTWKTSPTSSRPTPCTSANSPPPTPLLTNTAAPKRVAWCLDNISLDNILRRWCRIRCNKITSTNNFRRKRNKTVHPALIQIREKESLLTQSSIIRAVNKCWILGEPEGREHMPHSCLREAWWAWWTWTV